MTELAALKLEDARRAIEKVLPNALGMERFILLMGKSHFDGAEELFALLDEASRHIYVPAFLPVLQICFQEVIDHLSQSEPLLREIWAIPDAD